MKKTIALIAGLAIVLMAGLMMMDQLVSEKSAENNLKRAVIKIDTLSCGGCFSNINSALAGLEGYSGMGANLFRKLIGIDFKFPLTAEKISEKLIEIGYSGRFETIDSISEKQSFAYMQSRRSLIRPGGCCIRKIDKPRINPEKIHSSP